MAEMVHAMHNASASAIWLDCSLYYHFKHDAVKRGAVFDSSGKAAERGKLQHDVSEVALPLVLNGMSIKDAVAKGARKVRKKLTPEEIKCVEIAMLAAFDLITEDMEVEVEAEVPLSHEPGSLGYIDVAGVCDDHVLVLDYKFGQMAVSPNSPQLKIYAANMLVYLREQGMTFEPESRVKIAIVQPQLHREALVRSYKAAELVKFQSYVEGVVHNQTDGHDRRGAGSLDTCKWCPVRKAGCFHRANLMATMLRDLKAPADMADHVIEEVVRSRSAFKGVIEECVAAVVADPKRFPNWTRAEVNNARKWSGLLDASEIESQLIDEGMEDLYTLKSPAQVKDTYPDHVKKVDSLSAKQGTHVRLHLGAPKEGAAKKEPAKRASAKRAKPAKKSARKKAATNKKKKASKKK